MRKGIYVDRKKGLLLMLLVLISCNSIHENRPSYKNKINNTTTKTNTQKFDLIKTIVVNHGVFDELNFTFFDSSNYIRITINVSKEILEEFECIEELFWWNNESYFINYLLRKIKTKLYDEVPNVSKSKKKKLHGVNITFSNENNLDSNF
tara:strand:+ start:502 stop:951 length:450 start_codon:yes stop_codon:yes gene_type:complete